MHKVRDVTIYDIARKLNTSGATVCRALQDHPKISKQTKAKVFAVAQEIGYRVNPFASNLRSQHSKVIGVMVQGLDSVVMTSMLSGIEQIAAAEGYDIILAQSGKNSKTEARAAISLLQKRVDGLIACRAFDQRNFHHFFERGIPATFVDEGDLKGKSTSVFINNQECGLMATNHLVEQGCKRIVHLTRSLERQDLVQKFHGYRQALENHRLSFDNSMLLGNIPGPKAADMIFAMRPLPDGIFATDDMLAAHCMRELIKKGINFPEDIAIVGFNNDPVCELLVPALTSINIPAENMGKIAVSDLINHLRHKQVSTNSILLKAELVVRESSRRRNMVMV